MATPTSKFAGTLVLIAGAMFCVPQVAGASNAHRGPPARSGQHAATLAVHPATATARRCKTTTTEHHTSTTKDHDTTTVDHRDTTTTVDRVTTTTVAATTTTPAPRPTTTVTVRLIPPLVIFPAVATPDAAPQVRGLVAVAAQHPDAIVPTAAAQPVQAVGPLLPATGSGHVGVIALVGVCLIMLGLLIRRSTAQ